MIITVDLTYNASVPHPIERGSPLCFTADSLRVVFLGCICYLSTAQATRTIIADHARHGSAHATREPSSDSPDATACCRRGLSSTPASTYGTIRPSVAAPKKKQRTSKQNTSQARRQTVEGRLATFDTSAATTSTTMPAAPPMSVRARDNRQLHPHFIPPASPVVPRSSTTNKTKPTPRPAGLIMLVPTPRRRGIRR